jgi:hypothetical protein
MSTNVHVEVDEQTADVLQTRAAELGVTVSELVAELAMLESEPISIEVDDIAELDRRWKTIEAGGRTVVGFQQEGTLPSQNLSPLTCPVACARVVRRQRALLVRFLSRLSPPVLVDGEPAGARRRSEERRR